MLLWLKASQLELKQCFLRVAEQLEKLLDYFWQWPAHYSSIITGTQLSRVHRKGYYFTRTFLQKHSICSMELWILELCVTFLTR